MMLRPFCHCCFLSLLLLAVAGPAPADDPVEVDEAIIGAYTVAREKPAYHYLILEIDDDVIVREKALERTQADEPYSHERLLAEFEAYPKDSRFALVFFSAAGITSQPVLILWNPPYADLDDQLLYVNASETLKSRLPGINQVYVARSIKDLDAQAIADWWRIFHP